MMDAVEALGDPDCATEVAARVQPDRWVEAYPRGVFDGGDCGGDVQVGTAHTRRFVRWMPARNLWAVIDDSFYLCRCDHDPEDSHELDSDGEPRCEHCGALSWVEGQTNTTICGDFRDADGTAEGWDTTYGRDVAALASQETDAYARGCAERLSAEHYGAPLI